MRTLQFDAGNTRLKWLLRENALAVSSGFFCNTEDWGAALPRFLDTVGKLDLVSISMVSSDERLEQIKKYVLATQVVPLYIATAKKESAGVTLSYDAPEKLGVDRWLAMLAAHATSSPDIKVVVDCGTAITVDVLDKNGLHLGGYIVPGISLMKKTLASNTAKLRYVESTDNHNLALGKNTVDCIHHGALMMSLALIDRVVTEHPGSRVILTGGDGGQLESLISVYKEGRVSFMPDLVMDGLEIAAREYKEGCAG
ncbi:type III pantothenate kinase [Endozoicomonas montiporae]|uniref:Type III pantothenate kinase n=1 Tax=Endozoicomonas montiporae CL-33 TaxID=570277 RepID=A0A142BIE0_9GAMM|nr:type III pantothenate kinase [Endozoicomonas montiporae]AMO58516.1 Baf family transcriptional acitvator [Endozoicomonas montiporae CL-33]